MVDVIPTLRPRIKRSVIDVAVADLESSTSEDYHSTIRCWIDIGSTLTKESAIESTRLSRE